MAHTEKCRGCRFENRCDYITCQIQYIAEVEAKARAKAIDDFAEALYIKSTLCKDIESDDYGMLHYEDIYEVAEQLKEGGNDESKV